MGNAFSYTGDDSEECYRQFSDADLESLRHSFDAMAASNPSQNKRITASSFQDYFRIHGTLGRLMFQEAMAFEKSGGDMLSFGSYLKFKAKYCKCSPQELNLSIFNLLNASKTGKLSRSELEGSLISAVESIFKGEFSRSFVSCLLLSATFKPTSGSEADTLSYNEYLKWIRFVPNVRKLLGSALCEPLAGPSGRLIPTLNIPEGLEDHILLKKEYAWHIMGMLDEKEWKEWVLLYHSGSHGLSFNSFMGKVRSIGKSVLICKDKGGAVFGGYGSQTWERHSDFFGDMKGFMFTLHPTSAIYGPSGANSNIQWCAANFTSTSIPNGVGFGGQVGHFGLFLDSGFEQGHSRPAVTFNSPTVSSSPEFEIEVVECWGSYVEKDKNDSGNLKGTILDRFKEDRAVMNLVGIANSSDNIGEA